MVSLFDKLKAKSSIGGCEISFKVVKHFFLQEDAMLVIILMYDGTVLATNLADT